MSFLCILGFYVLPTRIRSSVKFSWIFGNVNSLPLVSCYRIEDVELVESLLSVPAALSVIKMSVIWSRWRCFRIRCINMWDVFWYISRCQIDYWLCVCVPCCVRKRFGMVGTGGTFPWFNWLMIPLRLQGQRALTASTVVPELGQ